MGTRATTGEPGPLLPADRRRHLCISRITGTGKIALLLNLMCADMIGDAGFCFLDPHGDAAKDIAAMTPGEQMNDVIYLDRSGTTHTFGYNPLAGVALAGRAATAANIVLSFKNIRAGFLGPRLECVSPASALQSWRGGF